LVDTINDLTNNSWGLARFANWQNTILFALKIFGLLLIGAEAVKLNFRQINIKQSNIEQVSRLEGILTLWVFIILLGLAGCFIILYADVFKVYGLIDSCNQSETHDPTISVYFSIITWTTVGYGDFRPTEWARLFAATEALIGYIWMGVLIAVLVQGGIKAMRNLSFER